MMASLEEIRSARLAKLKVLSELGIDPYPVHTNRDLSINKAIEKFDDLTKSGKSRIMAGRIMSLRIQGKIIFFDLYDGTGRFQIF